MATPTPTKLLFSLCSLLMASLFAFSASVQFNDSDWYFWFPLYATASVVNLVNWVSRYNIIKPIAKLALWLGVFLFIKVVIEDFVNGIAGFWSSDMRERVVREKFGSGLVVSSMFLQLTALSTPNHPTKGKKVKFVKYGMPILVGISCGLFLCLLCIPKKRNEVLIKQKE